MVKHTIMGGLVRRNYRTGDVHEREALRNGAMLHLSNHLVEVVHEYNAFLKEIVDIVSDTMDVERVSLLIRRGDHLEIAASCGIPEDVARSTRVQIGEGISGLVAATGEPILVEDGAKAPADVADRLIGGSAFSVASFISMPVLHGRQVLGVMNVTNPRNGVSFDEGDLEFLGAMVRIASMFLHRAQEIRNLLASSKTDELTGLGNDIHLKEVIAMEEERARRYGHPVSVVYFGVDSLDAIRNQHGPDLADVLVRNLGQHMKTNSRKVDYVFHLGRGRYVVLLPHVEVEKAVIYQNRIVSIVKQSSIVFSHHDLRVTLSTGLAGMPVHGEKLVDVIETARKAMCKARLEAGS